MDTSSEIWARLEKAARINCCYATKGETCTGEHPQGTRIVFGHESLSRGIRIVIQVARNSVLDEAIGEVSGLVTSDGAVLKSNVLEILNSLKLPGAR